MSTPAIRIPAPRGLSGLEAVADRYEGTKQYSLARILAVWAPSKRYQSAWIGIAVHSVQSVFMAAVILALVV